MMIRAGGTQSFVRPFICKTESRLSTVQETTLHTEEIYSGRVVHLAVLDVRLPDGKTAKREIIKHPGAVAVVALDDAQNVLLVRQFRLAADQVLREIPAGTLNQGEDPLACAERELQEETGFRPEKLEPLGGIFVAPGYTTEYIHLFIGTNLHESQLQGDDDEFLEVDRVPLKEAIAMIERGDIIDAKTVSALLRVARIRGI
jgi:ADP-ribose pyrophosphatase